MVHYQPSIPTCLPFPVSFSFSSSHRQLAADGVIPKYVYSTNAENHRLLLERITEMRWAAERKPRMLNVPFRHVIGAIAWLEILPVLLLQHVHNGKAGKWSARIYRWTEGESRAEWRTRRDGERDKGVCDVCRLSGKRTDDRLHDWPISNGKIELNNLLKVPPQST